MPLNKISINKEAASHLPGHQNVQSNWHVTLYHGAFDDKDLSTIKENLKDLKINSLAITFVPPIYSTSNRWIDLAVENTEDLQNLHEKIVTLISPYHKMPLQRSKDIYGTLDEEQQEQVNKYGMNGVMKAYKPHMSLFYEYPPSADLTIAASALNKFMTGKVICHIEKIAIGKLGYNGNLYEIIDTIQLEK